jgi:hypothetical protein
MTDYVVLPVPFSDGTNKALSFATARDGGFSDDELTLFTVMTPAVASNLEIQALRRMARTLLDTYVGRSLAAGFSQDKSGAAWARRSAPSSGSPTCAASPACRKACHATR